ncbi:MAG TPA: hypothetical protein VGG36_11850 [Rhizomicrobium sp.]|jgi:uncharacterized membrane protein
MSEAHTGEAAPAANAPARIAALVGYGLMIVAVANAVTAIAGVVLAYIKRAEARGTIWESHFTNMIRVFWTSVAAIVVFIGAGVFGIVDLAATADHQPHMLLIALLPALYLLGVGLVVWYLYRTIRGVLRALDNKAY